MTSQDQYWDVIVACAQKTRSERRVRCRWDKSDQWVEINDDCDNCEDENEMRSCATLD